VKGSLTKDEPSDSTLMAQREDTMLGKIRHDSTHVTAGMELDVLHRRSGAFG
jgi:hypothetical protein